MEQYLLGTSKHDMNSCIKITCLWLDSKSNKGFYKIKKNRIKPIMAKEK